MNLREGDKVLFRDDLELEEQYGNLTLWGDMERELSKFGRLNTVARVADDGDFQVEENDVNYWWSPEMVNKVKLVEGKNTEIKGGDLVRIKENLEQGEYFDSYWVDSGIMNNLGELVMVSDFGTDREENTAFHVYEISDWTAIMPGMVEKVEFIEEKTDLEFNLNERKFIKYCAAEQGEVQEFKYDVVSVDKDTKQVVYEERNAASKIIGAYCEEDLVDEKTARKLARDYHDQKLKELE